MADGWLLERGGAIASCGARGRGCGWGTLKPQRLRGQSQLGVLGCLSSWGSRRSLAGFAFGWA
eukprot:7444338-Pyramimonas_sp.AAC.2